MSAEHARPVIEPIKVSPAQQFVHDCRYVALVLGGDDKVAVRAARGSWGFVGGELTSRVYRDALVEIVCDQYTPSLLVTKLAQGAAGENPVAFIDERGGCPRWHGQYTDLRDHVHALVARIAQLPVGDARLWDAPAAD